MNCDRFRDDYELYALGILDGPEAAGIDEHLATGCETCLREVRRASTLNALLARAAPPVTPPGRLRDRIAASFGQQPVAPKRRPFRFPFALAAAAAIILALGGALIFEHRARLAEHAVAQSNIAELARATAMLEILQAPGTKQVNFGPQPATPHGSLLIHQKLGIILIAGGLPAPPNGWNYESWIVPKNGAPRPIEPFRAAQDGGAVSFIPGPVDLSDVKAVAVSIEPSTVPPSKPTKVIFAAPVGT